MTTSINEQTCFFIKIYTSHNLFSKGLRKGCVWEVYWRREQTATYWPKVLLTIAALLPHLGWAAILWVLRAQALCLELVLTLASYLQLEQQLELQLTQAICGTWLYNRRPPASCGRIHLYRIQPRPQVKVIFRYLQPDALVSTVPLLIYTGASLNWRLGRGSICYNICPPGKVIDTWVSPKFCNILVTWGTIQLLQMLLKVINHTGLWDAKLAWYSPDATHQICHYGLEHKLRIHGIRPTWPCLIIEVLATWVEFLQPSGYYTTINCAITFCTTNVFWGSFHGIMALFKLIKHKFLNLSMLHIHLCSFQITHAMKQCTMCQHTNYHNTTKSQHVPFHSLNCFSHIIYTLQTTKILLNFWLNLVN